MTDIYESTRDLYQIFDLAEPVDRDRAWTHGPSAPVQIDRTVPVPARHNPSNPSNIAGLLILGAILLPIIGSTRR